MSAVDPISNLRTAIYDLPSNTYGSGDQNDKVKRAATACLAYINNPGTNLTTEQKTKLEEIKNKYNEILREKGFQRWGGLGTSTTQQKVVELFEHLMEAPPPGYMVIVTPKKRIRMEKVAAQTQSIFSRASAIFSTRLSSSTSAERVSTQTWMAAKLSYGEVKKYYKSKVIILNEQSENLMEEITVETPLTHQNLASYTKRIAALRKELNYLQSDECRASDKQRHQNTLSTIQVAIDEATTLCLSKTIEFLKKNPGSSYKTSSLDPSWSRVSFDTSSIRKLYEQLPAEASDEVSKATRPKLLAEVKREYADAYQKLEDWLLVLSQATTDEAQNQLINDAITRYLLTQNLLRELDPHATEFSEAKYKLSSSDLTKLVRYAKQIYVQKNSLEYPSIMITEEPRKIQLTEIAGNLDTLDRKIPILRGRSPNNQPGNVLKAEIKKLRISANAKLAELSDDQEFTLIQKFDQTVNNEIEFRHLKIIDTVCDIICRKKQNDLTTACVIPCSDLFTDPPPENWITLLPEAKIWILWIQNKTSGMNKVLQRRILSMPPKEALRALFFSRNNSRWPSAQEIAPLQNKFSQHLKNRILKDVQDILSARNGKSETDLVAEIQTKFPSLTVPQATQLLKNVEQLEIRMQAALEEKTSIRDELIPHLRNSEDFHDWKIQSLLEDHLTAEQMGIIQPDLEQILRINISREELEAGLEIDGDRYINLTENAQLLRREEDSQDSRMAINALGRQITQFRREYQALFPDPQDDEALIASLKSPGFANLIQQVCIAIAKQKELQENPENITALTEINRIIRHLTLNLKTKADRLHVESKVGEWNAFSESSSYLILADVASKIPISNSEILTICRQNTQLILHEKEKYEILLQKLRNGEPIPQIEVLSAVDRYTRACNKLKAEMDLIAPRLSNLANCHRKYSENEISGCLSYARQMAQTLRVDQEEALSPSNLARATTAQKNTVANTLIDRLIGFSIEAIEKIELCDRETLIQKAYIAENLGALQKLQKLKEFTQNLLISDSDNVSISSKRTNLLQFQFQLTAAQNEIVPNLSGLSEETTFVLKSQADAEDGRVNFSQISTTSQRVPVLNPERAQRLLVEIEALQIWVAEQLEIFSEGVPPTLADELTKDNTIECRKIAIQLSRVEGNDEDIQEKIDGISQAQDHLMENFLSLDLVPALDLSQLSEYDGMTDELWERWAEQEYTQILKERSLEGIEMPSDGFEAHLTDWVQNDYVRQVQEGLRQDTGDRAPPPTRKQTLQFLSELAEGAISNEKLLNRFQCYLLNIQIDMAKIRTRSEDQLSRNVESRCLGADWKKWADTRMTATRRIQDATAAEKSRWETGGIQYLSEISQFRAAPIEGRAHTLTGKAKRTGQIELEFITEQLIPTFDASEKTKKSIEQLVIIIKTIQAATSFSSAVDIALMTFLNNPQRPPNTDESMKEAARKLKSAEKLMQKMIDLQAEGQTPSFHEAIKHIITEETSTSTESLSVLSKKIAIFLNDIGIKINSAQTFALLIQMQEYRRLISRANLDVQADQMKDLLTTFLNRDTGINREAGTHLGLTDPQINLFEQHYIPKRKAQELLSAASPDTHPSWDSAKEKTNQFRIRQLSLGLRELVQDEEIIE